MDGPESTRPEEEKARPTPRAASAPPAGQVVARGLVLASVVYRAFIDTIADRQQALQLLQMLQAWLRDMGLMDEVEPGERAFIETPVGDLFEQAAVTASWRSEGLVVLVWALGRGGWPVHDVLVDPSEVVSALGFFDAQAAHALIRDAQLRSLEELRWAADLCLSIHARLEEYTLRPEPLDFEEYVRQASLNPEILRGARTFDRDLAIDRGPVWAASHERFQQVLGIARERHRAANWLLGQNPVYSCVQADTSSLVSPVEGKGPHAV
jgi:hypothetical protein